MVPELLVFALDFFRSPLRYRQLTEPTHSLPKAFDTLLPELAAAITPQNIATTAGQLGRPPAEIEQAALFLIRQILFTPGADHYRVLGLSPDAPETTVRQHYQLLIRLFHPDRSSGDKELDAAYTVRLNDAYSILRDPETRRHYDEQLSGLGRQRESAPESLAFKPSDPFDMDPRVLASGWWKRHSRHSLDLGLRPPIPIISLIALAVGLLIAATTFDHPPPPALTEMITEPMRDEPDLLTSHPMELMAQHTAAMKSSAARQALLSQAPSPAAPEPEATQETPSRDPPPTQPHPETPQTPPSTGHPAASPLTTDTAHLAGSGGDSNTRTTSDHKPLDQYQTTEPRETSIRRAVTATALSERASSAHPTSEPAPPTTGDTPSAPPEPRVRKTDGARILEQFTAAYRSGDIDALTGLFTANALVNEGHGVTFIRQDYAEFFRRTRERVLHFDLPVWRADPSGKLIGQTRVEVKSRAEGDRTWQSLNGTMEFAIVQTPQGPRIARMLHKLEQASNAERAMTVTQDSRVAPLPVSARQADDTVAALTDAYERGDVSALVELFATDARVNGGRGKAFIHRDYSRFFVQFPERKIQFVAPDLQIADNATLTGVARSTVAVRPKVGSDWAVLEGTLDFELISSAKGPKISRMFDSLQ